MESCTLFAPAKLNLGLRVVGRYADGYHHLESCFVPISLYDRIEMRSAAGAGIRYHWNFTRLVAARKILIKGAAENPLLWKSIAGVRPEQNLNLHLRVQKQIPSPSGLGGASSDAAAVLAHLLKLTGPEQANPTTLHETSALGADIPYFLQYGLWGQAALLSGVGAQLSAVTLPELSGFVAVPNFGFSTARMFGYFRNQNLPVLGKQPPVDSSKSKSALRLSEIPYSDERFPGVRIARNDFEQAAAAVFPREARLLSAAQEQIARFVAQFVPAFWLAGLTGSGPAFYAATETPIRQADLLRLRMVLQRRLGDSWQVYPFRRHRL